MPSGAASPLPDDEWKHVVSCFEAAEKEGLVLEWLRWFAGGITVSKLSPTVAATEACIEWDI